MWRIIGGRGLVDHEAVLHRSTLLAFTGHWRWDSNHRPNCHGRWSSSLAPTRIWPAPTLTTCWAKWNLPDIIWENLLRKNVVEQWNLPDTSSRGICSMRVEQITYVHHRLECWWENWTKDSPRNIGAISAGKVEIDHISVMVWLHSKHHFKSVWQSGVFVAQDFLDEIWSGTRTQQSQQYWLGSYHTMLVPQFPEKIWNFRNALLLVQTSENGSRRVWRGASRSKWPLWSLNPRPMAHKTIALSTEL